VIPHLFNIIPGGTYIRQDGKLHGSNPYSFGQLKEICDHTHHKESGWAHAGLLVMQGKHVPDEYQNSVLMGSIHGCSIKRDVLRRNGSTFTASHAPDFLVSGDKNFRPINMRWGPDGSIYLIDWHDQNPCHQTPPDNWDYTHGRIYKIQRKGTKKSEPVDLAKKTSKELVVLLTNDNPWWHRTALPGQPRLVGQPDHQRQTGIAGVLLVFHQVVQQRQRVFLPEALGGARQLRPYFRGRVGPCQFGQAFQHLPGNAAGFTEEPDPPSAHPRTLVGKHFLGERLVERAHGV